MDGDAPIRRMSAGVEGLGFFGVFEATRWHNVAVLKLASIWYLALVVLRFCQ